MIASTQTNHPLPQLNDESPTAAALQIACNRLKSAGLRITQPRIAILEALIKRALPASIEQIHAELSNTACDLVTVYRCLAAFEELGLVRRCFFHNGTSLYQIALDDAPAYHVVDKASNAVGELDSDLAIELSEAMQEIEKKLIARGYTNVSHMVEFFARAPKHPIDRVQHGSVMAEIR
ncbi:Fur family transcriptional regulator [Synoicihabitans lomoniglobus]|uniref:Transcriptional repressor n=1 Tax=Synoicihabitans lomoniglobus TaxID=2909285 RepID=A0AAF0CQ81_9BACT|nr:transcriptional repressor [Opitutaceae bacterium LMO-M01]WED66056.1 transcriptional repressor [Opitutaceae bacterium LMO-M01]